MSRWGRLHCNWPTRRRDIPTLFDEAGAPDHQSSATICRRCTKRTNGSGCSSTIVPTSPAIAGSSLFGHGTLEQLASNPASGVDGEGAVVTVACRDRCKSY